MTTAELAQTELTDDFCLGGVPVRVSTESVIVRDEIRRRLGEFTVAASATEPFVLRVTSGAAARSSSVPAEMRELARDHEAELGEVALYGGAARRRIELVGRLVLEINLPRRRATIEFAAGCETWVFDYGVVPAVRAFLRAAGRWPLHAACLTVPDVSNEPRGVLIVGESGAGKTTTALALALSGWTLETDELTFFVGDQRQSAAAPLLYAFPRACRVRRGTFGLVPQLSRLPRHPTPEDDVVSIELDDLPGGGRRRGAQGLQPGLIVCLDRPNPEGHHIQSLDPTRALLRLAQENVGLAGVGEDDLACRAFEGLAELVRRVPICRLSVGPQFDALPRILTSFIGH